jgi:hypothetical protein
VFLFLFVFLLFAFYSVRNHNETVVTDFRSVPFPPDSEIVTNPKREEGGSVSHTDYGLTDHGILVLAVRSVC